MPATGSVAPGEDALARHPDLAAWPGLGLTLEGVALAAIAARWGTPTYVYGASTLRARARRLAGALPGIALHYAVKANGHVALLRRLAEAGLGADVVSGGELRRALHAGVPAARIVFSGVGKSAEEIALAAGCGIGQVNAESLEELDALAAAATGGTPLAVALRVNPDVAAGGHDRIATGRASDKFGIAMAAVPDAYARLARAPGLRPAGLAVHLGSQIVTAAPYRAAYARIAGLVRELRAAGHRVEAVDAGGGLGIATDEAPAMRPEAWGAAIAAELGGLGLRLSAEPGRWIAAPAGLLLARVVTVRRADRARPIVVLDAGMAEFLRPALYGARHPILPVSAAGRFAPPERVDVVGPVCESGDRIAGDVMLPRLAPGDLVAILDAGAYGAVMRSAYNARPGIAEILIEDGRACCITPRPDPATPWAGEILA
jgi:diaminopimelate decarboxylase